MTVGCKTLNARFNDTRVMFNSRTVTFNGSGNNVGGAGLDYAKDDFSNEIPKDTDYQIAGYSPNAPVDMPNGLSDDNCDEVCPIE